jgi:hypothetical protein
MIYDQVGSPVVKQQWPEGKPLASKTETILWNGTNRNGRFVGDGTYLCYVRIFDRTGAQIFTDTKLPLKIGVKRGKGVQP